MDKNRKIAIIVGALILFAYAVLASSVLESKIMSMLAEALSGMAVIAIAVLMFPFFKPYGKEASFWYLVFRGIEGGLMIVAGILLLFSSALLQEIYDKIYVAHAYIFVVAAVIFYYLLYQSKLIPRWLSMWGIIAAILLLAVNLLEAMGAVPESMVLYLPIILNEFVLAIWLIFKGFDLSAAASESAEAELN